MTPEKEKSFLAALGEMANKNMQRADMAENENEQMAERLFEMQTTVEVQAEALERNDERLMDFVGKLNNIMGGEIANEESAIARMTYLRQCADRLEAIEDMLKGRLEPDEQLRVEVATALRAGERSTMADLLARASALADVEVKNAELFRLNIEAEAELCKLREDAAE